MNVQEKPFNDNFLFRLWRVLPNETPLQEYINTVNVFVRHSEFPATASLN